MESLNLPPCSLSVRHDGGRAVVLDVLRRRWVVLTPEEWVRQHFTRWLTEVKGYPPTLLQNEVELRCGEKRMRCDTVLYGAGGRVRMIIEYKAPTVAVTQRVFNQLLAYNTLLRVDYLVASNGMRHICCRVDYASGTSCFLPAVPDYAEL